MDIDDMNSSISRSYTLSSSRVLDLLEIATRFWGIMTMIVMWGVGADLTIHKHSLGEYTLVIAGLLTLLETSFAVNLFLDFIIKDEKNCCYQLFQFLQKLDFWKKPFGYFILSCFCFISPRKMWLAAIGGAMLLILSILYTILSYKIHVYEMQVLTFDKECSYGRFDDLQDEIDDSLPELNSGTVGDQDTVLRV